MASGLSGFGFRVQCGSGFKFAYDCFSQSGPFQVLFFVQVRSASSCVDCSFRVGFHRSSLNPKPKTFRVSMNSTGFEGIWGSECFFSGCKVFSVLILGTLA